MTDEASKILDQSATVQAATPTILIVDNDGNGGLFISTVLNNSGYHTLLAGSGAEALELAARAKIDLLLTDLMMPQMNGPELALKIRALFPEIKEVFMSGFTEAAALRFGYMPKAPFLEKPISSAALRRKVAEVLSSRFPSLSLSA